MKRNAIEQSMMHVSAPDVLDQSWISSFYESPLTSSGTPRVSAVLSVRPSSMR